MLAGDELDEALLVAADFIDLKSPYMGGHSRRCAQLAADAARVLGLPDDAVTALRRAALVHDFGTTAVSNAILDKPGTLTRAEFDRVELHPMLTEQMLRRSPALAALNPSRRRTTRSATAPATTSASAPTRATPAACILAATEIYVGLTTERADRPPFSRRRRRRRARAGSRPTACSSPAPTRAVLVAAGHGEPAARARRRPDNPGGLSRREVDVLGLAARGLTTRQIADRLVISPKTADHHIQHIYTKIGVSTRAAAALWAIQHDVVR